MLAHLSSDLLLGYVGYTLSDRELTQVNQHALSCEDCLIKLRKALLLDEMIKICEYRISFEPPENVCEPAYEGPDHLSFQERFCYVRGELEEAHRILVQSHIEDCSMCAEEVQDLQAFAAEVDFCCLPLAGKSVRGVIQGTSNGVDSVAALIHGV